MNGLLFASYVVLWILMIAVLALQFGVLRQLGLVNRNSAGAAAMTKVDANREDGPELGSGLPELVLETTEGRVDVRSRLGGRAALVLILSPLCPGCQDAVEPVNQAIRGGGDTFRTLVVLHGDEFGCRSFLGLFPILAPVAVDLTGDITDAFQVHHRPFALVYGRDGRLARKAIPEGPDTVRNLLSEVAFAGDSAVAASAS